MATLYETTQQYRRDLLRKERAAAAKMTAAYSRAFRDINTELVAVRKSIQDKLDDGIPRDQLTSLLYREGRLDILREKVLVQVGRFSKDADIIIGGSTEAARELGTAAAGELIDLALPEGVTVSPTSPGGVVQPVVPQTVNIPTAAAERLVPAAQLLDGLAPQAAESVANALVSGIAQGKNPRVVARMMRDALGGNLTRALTISRTETLRAYREASREVYQQSPYVKAQRWTCALDERSCAACIALHGTTFPLGEPMAAHPNCRCTTSPVTLTPREIGFGGVAEPDGFESGVSWFRRQDAAVQERILGPTRYKMYRAKQVTLPDLVHRRQSPVWGASSQVASRAQAEANAAARRAR